jgi:hypothetical protein
MNAAGEQWNRARLTANQKRVRLNATPAPATASRAASLYQQCAARCCAPIAASPFVGVSEEVAPGGSPKHAAPSRASDVMVSPLAVEALNTDFYTVLPMDRLNPEVTQSTRR